MVKQNAIKVFEEKKVRTLWDSEIEEWYFSVVDVVAILTDSENPRRYWSDLKRKLLMIIRMWQSEVGILPVKPV